MEAGWRVNKLLEEHYSSCEEFFISGKLLKEGWDFSETFAAADSGMKSRLAQFFPTDTRGVFVMN